MYVCNTYYVCIKRMYVRTYNIDRTYITFYFSDTISEIIFWNKNLHLLFGPLVLRTLVDQYCKLLIHMSTHLILNIVHIRHLYSLYPINLSNGALKYLINICKFIFDIMIKIRNMNEIININYALLMEI